MLNIRKGDIRLLVIIVSAAFVAVSLVGSVVSAKPTSSGIYKNSASLIQECSACHGGNGSGPIGVHVPRIDGMNAGYLVHAMRSMASGTWKSPIMSPIAMSLTGAQMQIVASYFSTKSLTYLAGTKAHKGEVEGWLLGTRGDWKRKIPACTQCHGDRGVGIGRRFPRLEGQQAAYIRSQIHAWRIGTRHDDPLGLMRNVANRLDRRQIKEVSWYFSELPKVSKMAGGGSVGSVRGFVDSRGKFIPPANDVLPPGPFGRVVRLGENVFIHTSSYAHRYSGNALSCENCHIDAGRLANSAPMWAAYVMYPAYRRKSGQVNTFAQRLQDCFRYSLNGTAPTRRSKVLLALESYSYFLANGAPTGRNLSGRGYPSLESPLHGMSYTRGRLVFRNYCSVCHGKDGQGRLTSSGRQGFPPLWGKSSFNWGAGMANIEVVARFIKANMPLGLGGTLTPQQAWDVAKFVDSHERPQDPRFNGSVSSTRAKYHDNPLSMYGKRVNGLRLGDPLDR